MKRKILKSAVVLAVVVAASTSLYSLRYSGAVIVSDQVLNSIESRTFTGSYLQNAQSLIDSNKYDEVVSSIKDPLEHREIGEKAFKLAFSSGFYSKDKLTLLKAAKIHLLKARRGNHDK